MANTTVTLPSGAKLKLTEAQQLGLKYFGQLELPDDERRALRKAHKAAHYPDPRVVAALVDKKLIGQTDWHYGALFRLTAYGAFVAQELGLDFKKD